MEARDIILRPVVTEASMAGMDSKRYAFDVDLRATKTQVRNAVKEILDVKVAKINIMNVKGRLKCQGRYEGYTKCRRKATVTLSADSNEVKLLNDNNESQSLEKGGKDSGNS